MSALVECGEHSQNPYADITLKGEFFMELIDFVANDIITKALECMQEKENIRRKDIQEKYERGEFPVSLYTWDNYKKSLKQNSTTKAVKRMHLETFYKICLYADVSADYLLRFIETKRKEETAETVRKEFGLTDEAMNTLRDTIDKSFYVSHKCDDCKDFTLSGFFNFMTVNFSNKFANAIAEYFYITESINKNKEIVNTDKLDNSKYFDCFPDKAELFAKFQITQIVDEFIDNLKKELKKEID